MSRSGRSSGSVFDVVEDLSEQLRKNAGERWEARERALVELQDVVAAYADAPNVFTKHEFKVLQGPLILQLKDLRSAIVREACNLVVLMAEILGDSLGPLADRIMPTIVEVLGCGNKVITGYIDDAAQRLLQNCRFRGGITTCAESCRTCRSKDVRECCIEYLSLVLMHWGLSNSHLHKHCSAIEGAIKACIEDASPNARATARHCFWQFREHWPDRADRLMKRLDYRTQKLLEKQPPTQRVVVYDYRVRSD